MRSYVPSLAWVERAYRQAKKHASAATPPSLAQLLWAWGEWGYSPRDKPLVNILKGSLRRFMQAQRLGGRELVMAMHGVSRLEPEFWPNEGWMALFADRAAPHLATMPTGEPPAGSSCCSREPACTSEPLKALPRMTADTLMPTNSPPLTSPPTHFPSPR